MRKGRGGEGGEEGERVPGVVSDLMILSPPRCELTTTPPAEPALVARNSCVEETRTHRKSTTAHLHTVPINLV